MAASRSPGKTAVPHPIVLQSESTVAWVPAPAIVPGVDSGRGEGRGDWGGRDGGGGCDPPDVSAFTKSSCSDGGGDGDESDEDLFPPGSVPFHADLATMIAYHSLISVSSIAGVVRAASVPSPGEGGCSAPPPPPFCAISRVIEIMESVANVRTLGGGRFWPEQWRREGEKEEERDFDMKSPSASGAPIDGSGTTARTGRSGGGGTAPYHAAVNSQGGSDCRGHAARERTVAQDGPVLVAGRGAAGGRSCVLRARTDGRRKGGTSLLSPCPLEAAGMRGRTAGTEETAETTTTTGTITTTTSRSYSPSSSGLETWGPSGRSSRKTGSWRCAGPVL